jgi:hypothetical protein
MAAYSLNLGARRKWRASFAFTSRSVERRSEALLTIRRPGIARQLVIGMAEPDEKAIKPGPSIFCAIW